MNTVVAEVSAVTTLETTAAQQPSNSLDSGNGSIGQLPPSTPKSSLQSSIRRATSEHRNESDWPRNERAPTDQSEVTRNEHSPTGQSDVTLNERTPTGQWQTGRATSANRLANGRLAAQRARTDRRIRRDAQRTCTDEQIADWPRNERAPREMRRDALRARTEGDETGCQREELPIGN